MFQWEKRLDARDSNLPEVVFPYKQFNSECVVSLCSYSIYMSRNSPSTEFQVVSTCPFPGRAWSLPPATVSDCPQTAHRPSTLSVPPASREVCLLSSHREGGNLQVPQDISRPNLCPAQLSFGSHLGLPFSYLFFPPGCLATPLDPSQAWDVSPVLGNFP